MRRIGRLSNRIEGIYDLCDWLSARVIGAFALISILGMIVLFGAGLFEIASGAWQCIQYVLFRVPGVSYSEVTTRIIHGVELLLLAPVAYLILRALRGYLVQNENSQEEAEAHGELLQVKGFIGGLLFALLATNASGLALKGNLSIEIALGSAALMLVITGYFWVLERAARAQN